MERKFKDFIKAKRKLEKNGLYKGIVAFGSARIPENDPHYLEIVEISNLCAKRIKEKNAPVSFITGGGPSVMKAWLTGAKQNGTQAAGFAMELPNELKQQQLEMADEEISCICQNFATRKSLFYNFARAIIIFEGGFGTMDEFFEVLCLISTKKIPQMPIFVYPASFYKDVFNFEEFFKAGTINENDVKCLNYCNTKEELLNGLYEVIDNAK